MFKIQLLRCKLKVKKTRLEVFVRGGHSAGNAFLSKRFPGGRRLAEDLRSARRNSAYYSRRIDLFHKTSMLDC